MNKSENNTMLKLVSGVGILKLIMLSRIKNSFFKAKVMVFGVSLFCFKQKKN